MATRTERPATETAAEDQGLTPADEALIGALEHDPQSTNRALAMRFGRTEVDIARRLRYLDEANLMRLAAVLDLAKSGYEMLVYTQIEFEPDRRGDTLDKVQKLARHRNAGFVGTVRGQPLLEASFRVKDQADLASLVHRDLGGLPGVVRATVDTTLQVRRFRAGMAQLELEKRSISLADRLKALEHTGRAAGLDELDINILAALQVDGRSSSREIARRHNVTEGTIRYRLGKLSGGGLMKITPMRDISVIGLRSIFRLRIVARPSMLDSLSKQLLRDPDVNYLATTTGSCNLQIIIVSPTLAEGKRAIERVSKLPGIERVHTTQTDQSILFDSRWQVLNPS